MPTLRDTAIKEAERVAQQQSDELRVSAGADLQEKSASVELAVQKKFGSKVLGSLWARYVSKPGPDDAAVGVTGRILFGRDKEN